MKRWDPQGELVCVLEALAREIVQSTEQELRAPYYLAGDASLPRSAREVRDLVAAAMDEETDPGHFVAAPGGRERCLRPH